MATAKILDTVLLQNLWTLSDLVNALTFFPVVGMAVLQIIIYGRKCSYSITPSDSHI